MRTKVLYIMGWGRSGSTILSAILGQTDKFFYGGEIHYIWERGCIKNWLCGCNLPFRECRLWRNVLDEMDDEKDPIDPNVMHQQSLRVRTRHLFLAMTPSARQRMKAKLHRYVDTTEKLYNAIRRTTGCSVIIDSSKIPAHAYVLDMIPSIDLFLLQLVRDPRASAYSWSQRRKREPDPGKKIYMASHNPITSSLKWDFWNVAAELMGKRKKGKHLLVCYENFITKPQATIASIMNMLKEESSSHFFEDGRTITLEPNHSIAGNPTRFKTGTLSLELDVEWKEKMFPWARALVTATTWPLLLKYGYHLN